MYCILLCPDAYVSSRFSDDGLHSMVVSSRCLPSLMQLTLLQLSMFANERIYGLRLNGNSVMMKSVVRRKLLVFGCAQESTVALIICAFFGNDHCMRAPYGDHMPSIAGRRQQRGQPRVPCNMQTYIMVASPAVLFDELIQRRVVFTVGHNEILEALSLPAHVLDEARGQLQPFPEGNVVILVRQGTVVDLRSQTSVAARQLPLPQDLGQMKSTMSVKRALPGISWSMELLALGTISRSGCSRAAKHSKEKRC
ncbi:hypothetical protein BD414DRAFT_211531 [Trametes punicea]|nr:hypothetical protein BD414DRAFT_211531 [Trametes punicea]